MAISGRWAIQEIFDILLTNPVTDQIYCKLSDLKTSSFAQDGVTVYAQGGKGNPKIVGFDHSKSAKFTIGSATFLADLFAVQSGAAPVTGSNTNLVISDTLTVTSNVATTSATPLGTTDAEIGYAYIIDSDGSLGTEYEQASVVSTGKFTLSGTTITFNAGDIADGTQIFLKYNATSAADTVTYSGYTNVFSKHVKLIADTVVRDCNGTDKEAQLIFYNAKVNNNFTFDLASDGDPAIQNLEVEALKSCTTTKLWDLILYDADTVV